MKFVHKGPINYIPTLVQVMACHWPGNKPLLETIINRQNFECSRLAQTMGISVNLRNDHKLVFIK